MMTDDECRAIYTDEIDQTVTPKYTNMATIQRLMELVDKARSDFYKQGIDEANPYCNGILLDEAESISKQSREAVETALRELLENNTANQLAAAITSRDQRIVELEAAILRTYGAKGRYHTEQSAKEMFALVNAA